MNDKTLYSTNPSSLSVKLKNIELEKVNKNNQLFPTENISSKESVRSNNVLNLHHLNQ